ncbi:MAG: response regulator [Deltaproteobacteria bacterium]|jgi:signal transduction histidine kinase/DNA-binding response OmpR family regulator/HPt (histidine-containing phosphotransfer) domain-containing protein|nr:response regulator [Deltaproteobacteria bacterium]
MTFRLKIFSIIVGIVIMVVITIIGTSLYFIRTGIEQTVMGNLNVIKDIADHYVSSEINLLVTRANAIVNRLKAAPLENWQRILRDETSKNIDFKAISVIARSGMVVAGYGYPQAGPDLLFGDYSRRSFNGESLITTTRQDPTGELVFYILVPVSNMIMSVTISGWYFSNLLDDYQLWKSGSIFILDREGTVIANNRRYYVGNRYNPLWDPGQSDALLSTQAFARRMLKYPSGSGRYTLEGQERLVVFTHLSSEQVGWVLGVSSPLAESPAAQVDRGMLIMTILFVSLGALLAFWASGILDKQFKTIEYQYAKVAELSAEAKTASEAKTTFLANMSHEMRTPLNAIIGFSELIIHGHTEEDELEDSLQKIHSAGLILLGIVNDILDITKIEAGKFDLIPVDYDLASLINDTVTVNLIRITDKPIEFGLELDSKLPSRLFGDELRIKQLINNLLSNAFKYTMEGNVDLSVTGKRDGSDFFLTVTVKDTGIGIKPEDLNKLFSEYSQLDTKSNRKIEGTGLGLAITRRLVDMMDGTIKVESQYGYGSTFSITIKQKFVTEVPIGKNVADNLENFELRQSRTLSNDMSITALPYARVLVVDDVKANLDVARGMLKPYGMQIDCATSGQAAIDLLSDQKVLYDAVFMDHMMPGMDGIEATHRIRETIGTDYARNIPIIALTANAIVGNEKMFLENGFQAFLTKPIEMKRMDLVLRQYVRNKDKEAAYLAKLEAEEAEVNEIVSSAMSVSNKEFEAQTKAAQGASPKGPPLKGEAPKVSGSNEAAQNDSKGANGSDNGQQTPKDEVETLATLHGLDVKEGLKRFSGDKEIYLEVIRSYAQSVQELMDQLTEPNYEDLQNYIISIHGVKSSSYGICAKEVGQLAENLEHKAAAGDLEYVKNYNPLFLTAVTGLTQALEEILTRNEAQESKPVKDLPDPEILQKLKEACASYDMDGVDQAIEELESFSYSVDPHIAHWLRERVDHMEFQEILDRLEGAYPINDQQKDTVQESLN